MVEILARSHPAPSSSWPSGPVTSHGPRAASSTSGSSVRTLGDGRATRRLHRPRHPADARSARRRAGHSRRWRASMSPSSSSPIATCFGAHGLRPAVRRAHRIPRRRGRPRHGGHTRIWRRSSSRRDENYGDGMRLALDAGCRLMDMELVQFHPTGMVFPEEVAGTLVPRPSAARAGGCSTRSASASWSAMTPPARTHLA